MNIVGKEAEKVGEIWIVKDVRPDEVGILIELAKAELGTRLVGEPRPTQQDDDEFWVSFHIKDA